MNAHVRLSIRHLYWETLAREKRSNPTLTLHSEKRSSLTLHSEKRSNLKSVPPGSGIIHRAKCELLRCDLRARTHWIRQCTYQANTPWARPDIAQAEASNEQPCDPEESSHNTHKNGAKAARVPIVTTGYHAPLFPAMSRKQCAPAN